MMDSEAKFPWIRNLHELWDSPIPLLTYPLFLLECSFCISEDLQSQPSQQVTGKQNSLKRNGITKQFSSPFPHLPRNLSPWLLFSWPLVGVFGMRRCSKPLWMSSILVLLPSLRKMNREPHSQQEKVGAKRVKILLEELFLPIPHH